MRATATTLVLRMRAEDVEIVASLVREIVSPLGYYNERARREEIAKYGAAELSALVEDDPDAVLLATVEGVPAGFCISRYDDGLLWLSWVGVSSSFRSRGIGEALLSYLESTLAIRNAHKVWCDTRTDNTESQRLLKKLGYMRIGILTNHWYGQDFILWEKYPS